MTDRIAKLEEWEHSKENIMPLREGRKPAALSLVYNDLPSNPLEREKALERLAANFQARIDAQSNDHDDPLQLYSEYFSWALQVYTTQNTASSAVLFPLVETIAKKFLDDGRYANDPRLIKIWLCYCHFCKDPLEIFQFMEANQIGQLSAAFYEEYAAFLEFACKSLQKADRVLQLGIQRHAMPAERLKKYAIEFEKRMITTSLPSQSTMPPAGAIGLSSSRPADPPFGTNVPPKQFQVFEDKGPQLPLPEHAQKWSLSSQSSRNKENSFISTTWLGQKMKSSAKPAPKGPKINVYKDPLREIKGFNESLIQISGKEVSFEERRAMDAANKKAPVAAKARLDNPFEEKAEPVEKVRKGLEELRAEDTKGSGGAVLDQSIPSPTVNTKAALEEIMKMFKDPIGKEGGAENDTMEFPLLSETLPSSSKLSSALVDEVEMAMQHLKPDKIISKPIEDDNPFVLPSKDSSLRSILKKSSDAAARSFDIYCDENSNSNADERNQKTSSLPPVSEERRNENEPSISFPDYHKYPQASECDIDELDSFKQDDLRLVIGSDVHYVKKKVDSRKGLGGDYVGQFLTTRLGVIDSDDITMNPCSHLVKITRPPHQQEFLILKNLQVHAPEPHRFLKAKGFHCYTDMGMLILEHRDQGTLSQTLDLYKTSGMEEPQAVFFAIEILKALLMMHSMGLYHQTLSSSSFYIKLDEVDDSQWGQRYCSDGSKGWNQKGLVLGNMDKCMVRDRMGMSADQVKAAISKDLADYHQLMVKELSSMALKKPGRAGFDWFKNVQVWSSETALEFLKSMEAFLEAYNHVPSLKSMLKRNEILIYENIE